MTHKSQLGELTIDCPPEAFEAAVEFWSRALGYAAKDADSDDFKVLETPADEVAVNIQRVDHEPRVHLDIETDDIAAEVARLEKLGAVKVRDGKRWVVMRAPSGHGFCVVNKGNRGQFDRDAKTWT